MNFAEVTYADDGTPSSAQFNDVYFSSGQGPDETQFVFIEQNELIPRFKALKPQEHFCIAETGFGTGLNFLVAWRNFLEHASDTSRLTFISCEKYPLKPKDLARAHENWPELAQLSEQVQSQYPLAMPGFHLLEFDRVNLILMYDDASTAFSQLSGSIDAWFLDGFSPSQNPDMWQPGLFQEMQRLSHLQTTVATFTSARIVRDGLSGAGFTLTKVKGFGKKRHMLRGQFSGPCGPRLPTGYPCSELAIPKPVRGKNVALVGCGIAGLTTANELAARGFTVTLFDQHSQPAMGGSGNSQGAVYAKLSALPTISNQFYAQSLLYAQKVLKKLPVTVAHEVCGLVQLVNNERELKRLKKMLAAGFIPTDLADYKSAAELTDLVGIPISDDGLWFKDGGWLSPAELIAHWAKNYESQSYFNTQITKLDQTKSGWRLTSAAGEQFHFDQVVLTTAFETTNIAQTSHLPLNSISGQVTRLNSTDQHEALKAVICTDRYVMPPNQGLLTIGSTFRMKSTDTTVTETDHSENIKNLTQRLPGLLSSSDEIASGRSGVRCNAPDYLPLVGAIVPPRLLQDRFRIPLQRNRAHKEEPVPHWPGLWVNIAHGSKGLCSSHLCAKTLASMMSGEPLPLQSRIVQALDPNRFVVRALLREKRKKL